jgi:alkylhydroperoxidase family enzyme
MAMSWLTNKAASTPFEGFLAHRPELLAGYRVFYSSLWTEGLVPRRILELCRLRVAAIHGCKPEWVIRDAEVALSAEQLAALEHGRLESFDAAERAALTVAERVPYQHHALTDDEVAQVKQHLGDAGCVSLLNALVLFDVNCRLKLTFDVDAEPMTLRQPPSRDGALA